MIVRIEPEYGCIVTVEEVEADEFDDYLTEQRYVLFHMRTTEFGVEFLFGEASCEKNILSLVDDFKKFMSEV